MCYNKQKNSNMTIYTRTPLKDECIEHALRKKRVTVAVLGEKGVGKSYLITSLSMYSSIPVNKTSYIPIPGEGSCIDMVFGDMEFKFVELPTSKQLRHVDICMVLLLKGQPISETIIKWKKAINNKPFILIYTKCDNPNNLYTTYTSVRETCYNTNYENMNIPSKSSYHGTTLYEACSACDVETVKLLLQGGADPTLDIHMFMGTSPLKMARYRKQTSSELKAEATEIENLLLQSGAENLIFNISSLTHQSVYNLTLALQEPYLTYSEGLEPAIDNATHKCLPLDVIRIIKQYSL